jgi:hypothetical protein
VSVARDVGGPLEVIGRSLAAQVIGRPGSSAVHPVHSSFMEEIMRRALCLAMFVMVSVISGGCYVTQDANGQWWACDDYAAQNGTASACTPIQKPF